jgi:hypothetical protein
LRILRLPSDNSLYSQVIPSLVNAVVRRIWCLLDNWIA